MDNSFGRMAAGKLNDLKRSLGALTGIAQGLLGDGQLSDAEIKFLDKWLKGNAAVLDSWPGNVIHRRIADVLSDGVITDDERMHLQKTLQDLIGGSLEELAAMPHVAKLSLDKVEAVSFSAHDRFL